MSQCSFNYTLVSTGAPALNAPFVPGAGLIGAAELRDMLLSLPAMNYFSNPDGIMGVTGEEELHNPQALEQLASTVQQLLDDHDGDRGVSPPASLLDCN